MLRRVAPFVLLFACNSEPAPTTAPSSSVEKPAPASSARPTMAEVPITTKSRDALALFQHAYELQLNAHYAEATAELAKAVEKDPEFALALAWLGYLSTGAEGPKKLDEAMKLADKLPEPERLEVEELKARRAGDAERARELAKQVVAIAPFDWHAQLDLGNRYLDELRFEDASVALGKAAAFGPKFPGIYNALGYSYLMQRRIDAAVGTFRRYAQLAPDEPNALDSLGEALLMAGKVKEAEDAFVKAGTMGASYAFGGAAQARFFRSDWVGGKDFLTKERDASPLASDKLDADVAAVWSLLAQKKATDAGKLVDQIEKDAQAQKDDEHYALASVLRAATLFEDGKAADGAKEATQALERVDKQKVHGDAALRVRKAALGWRAFLEARAGGDASKTASEIEDAAKKAPADPELRSRVALGKGAALFAKGDAAQAVQALAECLPEDYLCRWLLLAAEEKTGDQAMMDLTRDALQTLYLRDPGYVYARAKTTK